jgi:ectoine hydroxylase-related dioxygenase (phytanoyl-CoA dioxygenase family)
MTTQTPTKTIPVIQGFEDSTPLLDDPEALQRRADAEGVLFFRGLLPRDHVMAVRRQLLEVLDSFGWLRKDADLMEGYVNPDAVRDLESWGGTGVSEAAYLATQKVEIFHRLAHHPDLIRMYEMLFGKAVLPHPRNIARLMVPCPANVPTPIHQDFIHIQGTRNVWTCWAPLGDVPLALGGLSVMPRSHKLGVLSVTAAEGAGGLETILCDVGLPWIEEDYRAGDVLTFNSCTVHKSLPNLTPERVRLSVDYRYQPADEDIEEKSLQPHMHVASWDEIYAGWPSDELKYYWTKHDLQLSPWDEIIRWQKEKIC